MKFNQICVQCKADIAYHQDRWIDETYPHEANHRKNDQEAINYAAWCTKFVGVKEKIDIYKNEDKDYDHKPDALVRLVMGE